MARHVSFADALAEPSARRYSGIRDNEYWPSRGEDSDSDASDAAGPAAPPAAPPSELPAPRGGAGRSRVRPPRA